MKTDSTLGEVFNQLLTVGFTLPENYQQSLSGIIFGEEDTPSPWYIRFFIGLIAWIAALFLIAFLVMIELIDSETSAVFVGLIFLAIAVGLNRLAPPNDFFSQLGLSLSLAGQALFAVGLGSLLDEIIPLALIMIVIESLLIWFYHDVVHRFISTVVINVALVAIIFDIEVFEAIHILVLILIWAIMLLHLYMYTLLKRGFAEIIPPVTYGLIVSFLGILLFPAMGDFEIAWWWLTSLFLLVALLYLIFLIGSDVGLKFGFEPGSVLALLVGVILLFIPALRMPGILGALIILLLGFWHSNRLLIGLAGAFLIFYFGAYYYLLTWTLLIKSFALIGSGLIFFFLRFMLLRLTSGELS